MNMVSLPRSLLWYVFTRPVTYRQHVGTAAINVDTIITVFESHRFQIEQESQMIANELKKLTAELEKVRFALTNGYPNAAWADACLY